MDQELTLKEIIADCEAMEEMCTPPTTKHIITLSITVELEERYAPTLEEAEYYLTQRVGAFLYPAGMKVLSAGVRQPKVK
jgi:hypothetical protein